MTSRRNKLLLKMLGTTTGETEEKLFSVEVGNLGRQILPANQRSNNQRNIVFKETFYR